MDPKDEAIQFQVQRTFAVLSRNLLCLLEDIRSQHDNAFDKLKDALPNGFDEYPELINYLNDGQFNHLRKRILDNCGQCRRDLENIIIQIENK